MKEYDVLVNNPGTFVGWLYVGRVNFGDIESRIQPSVIGEKDILHVSVTGSLSKEEKREIALRHGL